MILECLGAAFGHFFLGSHNFMVTTLGSCVKWPYLTTLHGLEHEANKVHLSELKWLVLSLSNDLKLLLLLLMGARYPILVSISKVGLIGNELMSVNITIVNHYQPLHSNNMNTLNHPSACT